MNAELVRAQKISYKTSLKQFGYSIVEQRILSANSSILEAQQSANSEEKSSAGDKYETSRAMGHLEKDMHSRQLAAYLKELEMIHSIDTSRIYKTPMAGALVECACISFFIILGLGKRFIGDRTIIFLSPNAPMAVTLFGKNIGDTLSFDKLENIIIDIY